MTEIAGKYPSGGEPAMTRSNQVIECAGFFSDRKAHRIFAKSRVLERNRAKTNYNVVTRKKYAHECNVFGYVEVIMVEVEKPGSNSAFPVSLISNRSCMV